MDGYVWQLRDWQKKLRWDSAKLIGPLSLARRRQGELLGKVSNLGFDLGREVQTFIITEEALTTAAIEGEIYDREAVRSSVARRLGLPTAGLPTPRRDSDGLVQVILDATLNFDQPLTSERLYGWQAALFPTGYSGMHRVEVGTWRTGAEPMRVVSGPVGKETIHYEAPPSSKVAKEMERFLAWWKAGGPPDEGLLRAGVAHFTFVTIHPFEDGNGRLARAIADMALAQDEGNGMRFYSMSSQIQAEREDYYAALQKVQSGDGDITGWLVWFANCLARAIERSEGHLEIVFRKANFWQHHSGAGLNERQLKAMNRLLDAGPDGFEGGLTTRKYVSMTRTSRATAQREITELLAKGFIVKRPGSGRSTSYEPAWFSGPSS